jgi:predicted Ser/Thr protein kinase
VNCPACNAPLPADAAFCFRCGARLGASLPPAPADPLPAGLERVLGHQYDILRLLGRGGMGAVYLARERALERAVAIKVLPPEVAADAESRERFRREARTAAKLTHPNIVPLYTFGDVEGMLYFVMGYVKGESLAERMRRESKLPAEDVRRILAEVADALHYAHHQGIVHRDIKPDNILLEDETGRPMLTDFGVAKAQASGTTLTEAGAVVGTPHYMSPEQASGARELDGRSDLYSLGIVGYQMLSGRLPFEGETFRDVIVQHVTREPAPLAVVAPDAPPDLAEPVMRCLAKEPSRRWGDGLQLRAALDLSDDEYELPAVEARLEGSGFKCAAWTWACAAAGLAWLHFAGGSPTDRLFGGFIALVYAVGGPVIVARIAAQARSRGVGWATIWRRILHPPRWWPLWWPRRWRRPGDVWDRLPGALRWPRVVAGASLAWLLFVSVPLGIIFAARLGAPDNVVNQLLMLALGWPPWAILGAAAAPVWWVRRRGIEDAEGSRVALASTSRLALWRNPTIATLLLPPSGRAGVLPAREPQSPGELASAIREVIGQLPADTRAAVSQAAETARAVLDLVATLDAELTNLARDADPKELEAVELKLQALGTEAADEGEMRREKRALLVHQRELQHRLNQRLAAVNDRRARLLDLLRTMWLQLANLRAEAARDAVEVTEVSGRVKALCIEIDAQVQAGEIARTESK